MRSTSLARGAGLTGLVLGLALLSALPLATEPAPRRLSVYSAAANYSLPIALRDGRAYIGLLELLDPLGPLVAKADGQRWRIRFNNRVQAEFSRGKSLVRIQGHDYDLGAPFLLEEDRGLVPLTSLNTIAPLLLGGPASLHVAADRMFIGEVGTHFTASVPPSDHPSLVLQFTTAVSPTVTTESGGLRLTFSHDAVVSPASPTLTFGNKAIPSATYSESNGNADIFVRSTNGSLVATISRDGKTIEVTSSSSPALASGSVAIIPSQPAPAAAPPIPQQVPPPLPVPSLAVSGPPVPRRYFVVLDASHGGDDQGEAISASLMEKDLTLSFSRRLREELEKLGITVLALRESDTGLAVDQRAALANSNHAAIYVALHASSSGHGVRVFTALLPSPTEDRGPFRSWETAQAPFRTYSLIAAAGISSALQQQQIPARSMMAPQRPLGNITEAALALEIAPLGTEPAQLASPDYQHTIAVAVAAGIASVRDKLGTVP